MLATETAYRPNLQVLRRAQPGEGVLVAFFSPTEYQKAQPTDGANGKMPSAELVHPARGFVFNCLGSRDVGVVGIVPDRPSMRQLVEGIGMIKDQYDLPPSPAVMVPDHLDTPNGQTPEKNLDMVVRDSANDVAVQLRETSPDTSRYHLVTLTNTSETQEAREALQRYGIDTVAMFGKKHYGYPNIYDRSRFAPFARTYGLPIPYSSIITDISDLDNAVIDVSLHTVDSNMFLKLSAGGGGYGVKEIHTQQDAQEAWQLWEKKGMFGPYYGQRAVAELQAGIPAISELLSFQYSHGHITTPRRGDVFGAFTTQYENGVKWEGNGFNVSLHVEPEQRGPVDKVINKFQGFCMEAMRREGGENFLQQTGGFDFALVDLRQLHPDFAKEMLGNMWEPVQYYGSHYGPVIIEHNGGRVSTATLPTLLAEQFGLVDQRTPFASMKVPGVASHLPDAWQFLQTSGLSYDLDTRSGVVPFGWVYDELSNIRKGDIFVGAGTEDDLFRVRDRAFGALAKEGLIAAF